MSIFFLSSKLLLFQSPPFPPVWITLSGHYSFSHWSETFPIWSEFASLDIIHCCLFWLPASSRSLRFLSFIASLFFAWKPADQLLGQNMRGPAPFYLFIFNQPLFIFNQFILPSFSQTLFIFAIYTPFILPDPFSSSSAHILTWLDQTFLSNSIKCLLLVGECGWRFCPNEFSYSLSIWLV